MHVINLDLSVVAIMSLSVTVCPSLTNFQTYIKDLLSKDKYNAIKFQTKTNTWECQDHNLLN